MRIPMTVTCAILTLTGCGGSDNGNSPQQVTTQDRKSTRLNSSHLGISYAVFCLKKNKRDQPHPHDSDGQEALHSKPGHRHDVAHGVLSGGVLPVGVGYE